jgi:pimeloyl-ACP methyl ester carboxylesterase
MRYFRSGTGPPLVLIHGLLGYSFSWRFVVGPLSQYATLYCVDMLGTGFSDRPEGIDATLRGSAERLFRFLDQIGVGRCDLLGSSRGGAIAMMAAALQPVRVRSLILCSPVNPWSSHGSRLAAFLSTAGIASLFVRLAPRLTLIHGPILKRLYGDTRRISPGTLEGYSAPYRLPGGFKHELQILRSWTRDLKDLRSMLPRISAIPTLLLWGSLDRAVLPESAVPLRQQFRHSRLVMFDGVGHLPYEEVPDQFNRSVIEFLTSRDQDHGASANL